MDAEIARIVAGAVDQGRLAAAQKLIPVRYIPGCPVTPPS
jgi:hypothetical protein